MATEIRKSQSALIRKSQLVSEKSTQRFAQLCPTPWALMPKVVGYLCPSYRSFVPIVSVIRAHVHGHSCSCSRAVFLYVLCAGLIIDDTDAPKTDMYIYKQASWYLFTCESSVNHKCIYLYQYKSIYRKCFNNDMQYLVMCSENIVRDNPKSWWIAWWIFPFSKYLSRCLNAFILVY